MSVIVRGMEMPKNCALCKFRGAGETWCPFTLQEVPGNTIPEDCPLIPVPPHGRLIDADALRAKMYHEAFETDSPMQRWDSGCWIRYKTFERMEESAPTIIPAEEETT